MGRGRHRGFTVRAPGAAPVTYRTARQAHRVAGNVKGARVTPGGGCFTLLLMLPWYVAVAAVKGAPWGTCAQAAAKRQ